MVEYVIGSSTNLGRGMEKEREAGAADVMGDGVLNGCGAVAAGADICVRSGGLARNTMLMLLSTASLDFCLRSLLGSKSAPGAREAVEVISAEGVRVEVTGFTVSVTKIREIQGGTAC